MRGIIVAIVLFLGAGGAAFSQKKAADPTQRYFRLICLVHLTGSGKQGDPIVPEYVVAGTATAQAAITAAVGISKTTTAATPVTAAAPPLSSRPGILSWSMQKTDDGKMAIVHIVAADPSAFAAILADTRPEIRVFQIGKDSKATIEATMRQYKKGFSLDSFEVFAQ